MATFPELIRSEEEMLKRLLLVSQRQMEVVEEGDFTVQLPYLLGKWQQLWNEFELLDRQLAPHKETLPENRVWKSMAERQITEFAQDRCKELLKTILDNYQICLTKMAAQKDEVAAQLRRIQRGGNTALGYMRQSQPPQ